MEIIVIGGFAAVSLFFVWIITQVGDQQWREEKHEEPPAPEWARVVFVLFFGGLLILCLVPGVMQGLAAVK